MILYRIFISEMGGFQDHKNYRFVADFSDRKAASNYVRYMRGKQRYAKNDIIIKELPADEIDATAGKIGGVIAVTGESLTVEEYEFQ